LFFYNEFNRLASVFQRFKTWIFCFCSIIVQCFSPLCPFKTGHFGTWVLSLICLILNFLLKICWFKTFLQIIVSFFSQLPLISLFPTLVYCTIFFEKWFLFEFKHKLPRNSTFAFGNPTISTAFLYTNEGNIDIEGIEIIGVNLINMSVISFETSAQDSNFTMKYGNFYDIWLKGKEMFLISSMNIEIKTSFFSNLHSGKLSFYNIWIVEFY